MMQIGKVSPTVFRDLSTRAERNQARFRAWLRSHPAAAEDLISALSEPCPAIYDERYSRCWNEAQLSVWH